MPVISSMQMRAVMALFDSELREEVFLLMELAKLTQYTHFVGLHGSSDKGKKESNVAWPGSNEILFLILSDTQYEHLKDTVKKFKAERQPPPGLLVFDWKLEGMV